MSADLWIIVPNWEKFQHYKDRQPLWIKVYLELTSDDDWYRLSLAERGLLVSLWVEYAASRGQLRTSAVPGRIGQKVLSRTWDSLQAKGFIELSASKPVSIRYEVARPEVEKSKRRSRTALDAPVDNTKEQRHAELLEQATGLADEWNGNSSDTFAEHLDHLERELHSRLTHTEREKLWAKALGTLTEP